MHIVNTDLNRRGAGASIIVNIGKFEKKPVFSDTVKMIDGEDVLYGVIIAVYEHNKHVLVKPAKNYEELSKQVQL